MSDDNEEEYLQNSEMQSIANQFDLGWVEFRMKLATGLINISHSVATNNGSFVFQKLNKIWDERVIHDYVNVQSYLRTNGLHVPVLLRSKNNGSFAKENGYIWRVFEWVHHDYVNECTPQTAYAAGKTLAQFHKLMSKREFKPTFELQGFHDTPAIASKLEKFLTDPKYKEKSDALYGFGEYILKEIPKFYLPANTKKIVIHGDPKLNNFLFKDGKVISLLDLDTMMSAPLEIDIGDAFRSWCRKKTVHFRI